MIGAPADRRFQVLFVCTGNICRSPLAERLLRSRLDQPGPQTAEQYEVHSAGVGALVGHTMDEQAAAALAELGGESAGFVARRVTEAMLRDAGLVLTLEEKHRSRVLQDLPTALRRTFTLREFAALCASLDGETDGLGPAELVRRAAARRGSVGIDDYDVPDPYRRTAAEHATAAGLIREAIDVIAPALVRAAGIRR